MVWNIFGNQELEESPREQHSQEDDARTVEEALECDYERDCTQLYKRLESEDYEAIRKFLDSGYWPGSFFPDGVTPQEQVKTWVTRFDQDNPKRVRWSQLPLHLAVVVQAPYELVVRLVEMYPQAVRCTDDQHMLPLHLAFRHGSSDQIIEFLLSKFPDAVNAKGKNDRTPIECAKRGPNKVRGKILEVFVTKTKTKRERVASHVYAKELSLLKGNLAQKVTELEDLKSQMAGMESAKHAIEMELNLKLEEVRREKEEMEVSTAVKIAELQNIKLVEEMELQRKIDELENAKKELQEAERKSRMEENSLRQELEAVQKRVISSSPADLEQLKEEVDRLKAYRLEYSRTKTQEEMDALKTALEENLKESEGKTKEELEQMKKVVEELRSVEYNVQTNEELNLLKREVSSLRRDLKDKEEASKTKLELVVLKKALEKELKDSEGKTKEELSAMRQAVEAMNLSELESKTNHELSSLKSELEKLKKDLKERELADKTMQDYQDLKADLERDLKESEGKTKQELEEMKKAVDAFNLDQLETRTNDELLSVKKELGFLKEELRQKEEASKMKLELVVLKKALEAEMKNSEGKTQEELDAIKSAVQNLHVTGIESKTNEELAMMKIELESLKEEMKQKDAAYKTKEELDALKTMLEEHVKESVGRTKDELITIKQAVDSINLEQLESKNKDEWVTMKAELAALKKEIRDAESAAKAKQDLESLKASLELELEHSDAKNKDEIAAMKQAVDSIDIEQLELNEPEEWLALQKELEGLKKDLKEKELDTLRRALEAELRNSEGKTLDELKTIQRAVDAINLERLENKTLQELTSLKKELEDLREQVPEKKKKLKGIKRMFGRFGFKKRNKKTLLVGAETMQGSIADSIVEETSTTLGDEQVETILPPSLTAEAFSRAESSFDEEQGEEGESPEDTPEDTANMPARESFLPSKEEMHESSLDKLKMLKETISDERTRSTQRKRSLQKRSGEKNPTREKGREQTANMHVDKFDFGKSPKAARPPRPEKRTLDDDFKKYYEDRFSPIDIKRSDTNTGEVELHTVA